MYKCTPLENGVHFFIGEKALGKDPFAPVSKERKIMITQKEKIQEEVAQVVETVKKRIQWLDRSRILSQSIL
mgnify:CR=1 FL=1